MTNHAGYAPYRYDDRTFDTLREAEDARDSAFPVHAQPITDRYAFTVRDGW